MTHLSAFGLTIDAAADTSTLSIQFGASACNCRVTGQEGSPDDCPIHAHPDDVGAIRRAAAGPFVPPKQQVDE